MRVSNFDMMKPSTVPRTMYLLRKNYVARSDRNDVMLAKTSGEATSSGVAVIISETTSFAVRQTSQKKRHAVACLFWGVRLFLDPQL